MEAEAAAGRVTHTQEEDNSVKTPGHMAEQHADVWIRKGQRDGGKPVAAARVHLGHPCTASAKRAQAQILAVVLIAQYMSIPPIIRYHWLMTLHTCPVTVRR
ncbi:unnamed protein product [Pleuronectes platessa]|uniref:Uncharacterized protein n=1 Tax=Pleuronectes platessa TaxID=8262 RepID=A0A9N7UVW7_PLEPL|nr:unnamed protein product [Pleuronectes platessa]